MGGGDGPQPPDDRLAQLARFLDDDVAAMCTGRSRHGIALVIDRGGFAHGQDEGGPAGATAQQLALGGWRAQVVSPGASLPEVWARATVGMGAIR